MKIFEPIYRKILLWAKHRHAKYYLAGVSFVESSFFPIPVDVMLAPMVLAKPSQAWRLASITTITSVLGGVLGYFIGAFFFDAYGQDILEFFNAQSAFATSQQLYLKYGVWIILIAGFSPIPYKIFTIASGVMGIAFVPFVLMSALARGARFFLVAGLVKLGGEKLEQTLMQKVELLGWLCVVLVVAGVLVYSFW